MGRENWSKPVPKRLACVGGRDALSQFFEPVVHDGDLRLRRMGSACLDHDETTVGCDVVVLPASCEVVAFKQELSRSGREDGTRLNGESHHLAAVLIVELSAARIPPRRRASVSRDSPFLTQARKRLDEDL